MIAKLNFHKPLLQSTVSHDPQEMLTWCSRSISFYYQYWKLLLILFLCVC